MLSKIFLKPSLLSSIKSVLINLIEISGWVFPNVIPRVHKSYFAWHADSDIKNTAMFDFHNF